VTRQKRAKLWGNERNEKKKTVANKMNKEKGRKLGCKPTKKLVRGKKITWADGDEIYIGCQREKMVGGRRQPEKTGKERTAKKLTLEGGQERHRTKNMKENKQL